MRDRGLRLLHHRPYERHDLLRLGRRNQWGWLERRLEPEGAGRRRWLVRAAPTLTGITPGNAFVSVTFTAGSAGGDAISSYQYSLDGGNTWQNAMGTSSPITISGLTNGTSYTVSLRR